MSLSFQPIGRPFLILRQALLSFVLAGYFSPVHCGKCSVSQRSVDRSYWLDSARLLPGWLMSVYTCTSKMHLENWPLPLPVVIRLLAVPYWSIPRLAPLCDQGDDLEH